MHGLIVETGIRRNLRFQRMQITRWSLLCTYTNKADMSSGDIEIKGNFQVHLQ